MILFENLMVKNFIKLTPAEKKITEQHNLKTFGDFLLNFPKKPKTYITFEDWLNSNRNLLQQQTQKRVYAFCELANPLQRKNLTIVRAKTRVKNQTIVLNLNWFFSPFIKFVVKKHPTCFVRGKISVFKNQYYLFNPKISSNTDKFNQPEYHSSFHGKTHKKYVDILKKILTLCGKCSILDTDSRLDMFGGNERLKNIREMHTKNADQTLKKKILTFSMEMQILNLMLKKKQKHVHAQQHNRSDLKNQINEFFVFHKKKFSYEQIKSSKNIIEKIFLHNKSEIVLQGEVGSGKTGCIFLISQCFVRLTEKTAVIISPTKILNRQTYNFFSKKTKLKNFQICDANNKVKKIEKQFIYICTHSIFFTANQTLNKNNSIKLVIIDEEQKFGIQQVQQLRESSKINEQSVVVRVSATPIPKTMLMCHLSYYFLEVLKNNFTRQIHTNVLFGAKQCLQNLICRIQKIDSFKCMIVTPFVEKKNSFNIQTIRTIMQDLCVPNTFYIHGRQKNLIQKKIISDYIATNRAFLIGTAVIETGINVKKANAMIILHPNHFSLAQLHQFRGRIGRNKLTNYLWVIVDPKFKNSNKIKKINNFINNTKGLKISNLDLIERGGGDDKKKQSGEKNQAVSLFVKMSNNQKQKVLKKLNNMLATSKEKIDELMNYYFRYNNRFKKFFL